MEAYYLCINTISSVQQPVAAERFSFDMQRRLTEFERTLPRFPHTDTGDCVARFQTVQGSWLPGYFIPRNWFWQLRDKLVGKTTFSHQLEDESPVWRLFLLDTHTRERKQFRERDKRIATVSSVRQIIPILAHEISPPSEKLIPSWRISLFLPFRFRLIFNYFSIRFFNSLICENLL